MSNLIKMVNVTVRERPALFSTPNWQEKLEDGSTIPAVEIWRDQRMRYERRRWHIGIWIYDYKPGTEIIGLLLDGPYPTHLAFELDSLLTNRIKREALEEGIYFDAGTSCTELYIEPDEWKRVLNELDVMSRYLALHPEAVDTKTEQTEESNPNVRSTEPVVNGR